MAITYSLVRYINKPCLPEKKFHLDMNFKRIFQRFQNLSTNNNRTLLPPEPVELENFQESSLQEITFTLEHDQITDHSQEQSNESHNNFSNPNTEKIVDDWNPVTMSTYGSELSENLPLRNSAENWSSSQPPLHENTGFFSVAYARHKNGFRFALVAGIIAIFIVIGGAIAAIIVRSADPELFALDDDPTNDTDYDALLGLKWPIQDLSSRKKAQFIQDLNNKEQWDSNRKVLQAATQSSQPNFLKTVSSSLVKKCKTHGQEALKARENVEKKLNAMGKVPTPRSPTSHHQYFNRPTAEAMQLSRKGYVMENSYKDLIKRTKSDKFEARDGLLVFQDSSELEWCTPPEDLQCNITDPYRSSDGSCNNLKHTWWGAANQPLRRILLPDYEDGISQLRSISFDPNGTLPNPREISLKIHVDNYREDSKLSMMFPLWGQFVDHDITATAASTGENGTQLTCCENGALVEPQHPECIPIYLSNEQDEFYASSGTQCMSVIRSAPFPKCELGPRQQFNQITSFLDLSVIYSSNENETSKLRVKKFGRLRTFYADDGRALMPILWDPKDPCNLDEEVEQKHFCFASGDARVNEVATLTSMHLIWTRHHNFISDRLVALNPEWDDEKAFQESRRIAIAQFQHITYNEFLPLLLGSDVMRQSGLQLVRRGYYTGYDASVNPTISNEFAASAFRFGHSMIQGLVRMIGPQGKDVDFITLHKLLFNPFRLWHEGRMDAILRGSSSTAASQVGTYFTKQLTQHLFQDRNSTFGLDLAAINLQRGRDHGLPPYVKWRQLCGFNNVTGFDDLQKIWDVGALEQIAKVYSSVQDVDSYTGLLAEKPIPGGILGPTSTCIIVDQFLRLRKGDRFWFEGDIQIKPFTNGQLDEIRKISLARVICDNGDDIKGMQHYALLRPSEDNPIVDCGQIPQIDYGMWKEKPSKKGSVQLLSDKDDKADDDYGALDDEVWDSEEKNIKRSRSDIVLDLNPKKRDDVAVTSEKKSDQKTKMESIASKNGVKVKFTNKNTIL